MRYLIFIAFSFLIFNGCDIDENDYSQVNPVGANKIESIQINGNQVKVSTSYGTPTPCWYYFKSEIQKYGDTYTSKVFAKDDGGICIQVIGSFIHEETFIFSGSGDKTLRFWQNDSSYLDTTITIQ